MSEEVWLGSRGKEVFVFKQMLALNKMKNEKQVKCKEKCN